MATVFTADRVRTAAGVIGDAVLIDRGRVVETGLAAALAHSGAHVEHHRGTLIPGLRDAHLHPVTYAAMQALPSLKTAADFGEIADRLRSAVDTMKPGVPLTALRLDDETLAEGRLPTRTDIDAMVADRPVLLHRYCGHVSVANTAALHLAGVDATVSDPPGGVIDRDADGIPTGVLREEAIDLVTGALADARPHPLSDGQLLNALYGLAAAGVTSIGAIVNCGRGTWADLGNQMQALAAVGRQSPIRLNVLVATTDPAELESAAAILAGSGDRIRFLGLKVFSDGSLGGHTAALHEPYHDQDTTGTLRLRPGTADMARLALDMAGMVAVHAIGDRANTVVLDLFEDLIRQGADPARLRVEHASVLTDGDIGRFPRLGVTASVQPAFMASETQWLEKRLGPHRLVRTYPLRSLTDAGTRLAGGSDSPVEPPQPLWGMATARDRAGIVPAEALDAAEALALFTTGAAAALQETEPLASGSPADFVLVDRDPLTATPAELRQAKVIATWVDGDRISIPQGVNPWPEE